MIFDFHTHCFPDALAPRAIAHLAKISRKCGLTPTTDGTAGGVLEQMHAHGVDKSLICNVSTNAHQMPKVNAFSTAALPRASLPARLASPIRPCSFFSVSVSSGSGQKL